MIRTMAKLGLAALVVLVVIGGSAMAQTADLPAGVKALLAKAKGESELTVFGQTVNPDQEKTFEKSFNAFYGLNAKLHMISALHPQKIAELIRAHQQGVPSGIDVFWTSATGGGDLDRAGMVEHVDWVKDVGLKPELVYGPWGVRAQDGLLIVVGYNTQQIPDRAKAPHSYEDLLDPKYKGHIAIPRAPGIFVFLAYYMGEEKAAKWLKDLIDKQQPRVIATFPDLRGRLQTGEFAVEVGADVFQEKRKGAPVDHAPVDPLIVTPWASHVMTDAKAPNLAELWSYWLATDSGQKAMDQFRGMSRVDVPGTSSYELAQGKKVVSIPADWAIKESDRLTAEYGKLMGLGR